MRPSLEPGQNLQLAVRFRIAVLVLDGIYAERIEGRRGYFLELVLKIRDT